MRHLYQSKRPIENGDLVIITMEGEHKGLIGYARLYQGWETIGVDTLGSVIQMKPENIRPLLSGDRAAL